MRLDEGPLEQGRLGTVCYRATSLIACAWMGARWDRYGGHVTDAFDRRLVMAYLENYLYQELLDGFQASRPVPRPRACRLLLSAAGADGRCCRIDSYDPPDTAETSPATSD